MICWQNKWKNNKLNGIKNWRRKWKKKRKKGSPKRVLFKEVVSLVKTTEKVGGNHSRDKEGSSISKKQKKTPANDAVAAKGIGDTSPVPSKSTKSKLGKIATKGPLGTHQSRKVGGKAIALKATEDAAISAAKIASPLKTIEKGADHPAGSKKQQKSPTNDVVETKGIGDSFSVPTTSTKSKKGDYCTKGTNCHSAFRQNRR